MLIETYYTLDEHTKNIIWHDLMKAFDWNADIYFDDELTGGSFTDEANNKKVLVYSREKETL